MLKNLSKLFILTFFIVGCETTTNIFNVLWRIRIRCIINVNKARYKRCWTGSGIYQEDAVSVKQEFGLN